MNSDSTQGKKILQGLTKNNKDESINKEDNLSGNAQDNSID